MQIAGVQHTVQSWSNFGNQRSSNVILDQYWQFIRPNVQPVLAAYKFVNLPPMLGPATALYWANCHFYDGEPCFTKISQSLAQWWHISEPSVTFITGNHVLWGKETMTNHVLIGQARVWPSNGALLGSDFGPDAAHYTERLSIWINDKIEWKFNIYSLCQNTEKCATFLVIHIKVRKINIFIIVFNKFQLKN